MQTGAARALYHFRKAQRYLHLAGRAAVGTSLDGLTPAQVSLLGALTGGPLTMSELAEAMNLSISHVSRLVGYLQDRGYVQIRTDPSDGRRRFVSLKPRAPGQKRKA